MCPPCHSALWKTAVYLDLIGWLNKIVACDWLAVL
jgi:hypothetical protein